VLAWAGRRGAGNVGDEIALSSRGSGLTRPKNAIIWDDLQTGRDEKRNSPIMIPLLQEMA